MDFTRALGGWIGDGPRCRDGAAVDAAERAIVDTVACIVAGAADQATRRVAAGLGGWGRGGRSSAAGLEGGLDAPWAALVNGVAAHALDYDDVLDPAASHPSAVLVPALLALAEETGAGGADLVDAYIVGVEVQQCLADAVNMAHYSRGWHTTLTFGAPSAAAACARLLRLGPDAACSAVSLATSMAAGFKRQFGTQAKPFHAGLGAKSGIVAARMAQAGLSADPAALEGERGFVALMAGPDVPGFDRLRSRLRQAGTPAVVSPGLWLKRYPCCASTHRPVDGFLELLARHGIDPDDIEQVDVLVSEPAVRNLMYDVPADEMQARFSLPYCIAAAARDGDLTLATFRRAAIDRRDIASFIPKVRMLPDPAQPGSMPATVRSWSTTTIRLRTGQTCSTRTVDPKGYPDNPLSETALERKFADCTAGQPDAVRASHGDWRAIGSSGDPGALAALLRTLRPAA